MSSKSDLVGKWKIAYETIAIRVKNSSQREKGFQLLPGRSITASTLPQDDNSGLTTGRRVSIVYRVKAVRERSSITFAMLHAVPLLRRDGLSNNLSRYLPSVISSQWSFSLSLSLSRSPFWSGNSQNIARKRDTLRENSNKAASAATSSGDVWKL